MRLATISAVPEYVLALFTDIADFPVSLQPMIQQGYLETSLDDYLTANMGYWVNADADVFTQVYEKNRGTTITRTRPGLKAPIVVATANAAAQTPPNDGVTPSDFAVEQYTFSPFELTDGVDLDLIGTNFAIVDRFEHQLVSNANQAVQSVDLLARDTYTAGYAVGRTIFTGTAASGAAGQAVNVDDIRGFETVITIGANSTNGSLTPTSNTFKMPITVYPGGLTTHVWYANVVLATPAGTNASKYVPASLTALYGAAGAPNSARFNGVSGSLTIDVVGYNITAGDVIVAGDAPIQIFPDSSLHFSEMSVNSGGMTSAALLNAVNALENNAVPFANNREGDNEGTYVLHCAPNVMRSLYNDADFKQANQTLGQSEIYLRGRISKYLGVTFLPNTNAPKIALAPYGGTGYANLSILSGQGAIIDAWYAGLEDWAMSAFNPAYILLEEGIAQILMPAYADRQGRQMHIDFLTIRDMVCPTDVTRATTILTGTASRRARAVAMWTWSNS